MKIEGVIRISNESLDAYGEEYAVYKAYGTLTFETFVNWRMHGWQPTRPKNAVRIRDIREKERSAITDRLAELHKQRAEASKHGFGYIHAVEITRLERGLKSL